MMREQGEARYLWKKIIFCFVLFKKLSNVWCPMMSVWYEKTKIVRTNSISFSSTFFGFKKNGMVPAMTEGELAELLSRHPEIRDVFIDGTERPIKRNKNYKIQKKEYSWKKKRHTIKNIIIVDEKRRILALWKTEWWTKHDYPMLQESWFMWALSWLVCWVDLWFIWIESDYPKHRVMIPKKSSKLHKLDENQKEENRTKSGLRVVVEHALAHVKIFQILAQRFRNRTNWPYRTVKTEMKSLIIRIVCWLINLRISTA